MVWFGLQEGSKLCCVYERTVIKLCGVVLCCAVVLLRTFALRCCAVWGNEIDR